MSKNPIMEGGRHSLTPAEVDAVLNELFSSTPLLFIKEFLREQKTRTRQIRIGETSRNVRSNLRDAILANRIGLDDVKDRLREVEGWGKQHVYLSSVPKRSLTHAQLLNGTSLGTFLRKRGFLKDPQEELADAPALVIGNVDVDDEVARINWFSHAIDVERREELDEIRDLDDGQYEFRAYRRHLRRSASRLIVRKTDGVVVTLVDLPLGDAHDAALEQIKDVANAVLAPLSPKLIPLASIVGALDEGAVAGFGPKPQRKLTLGVAPTQARYRTDGAQLEFKSTRQSTGYTDSLPVRHVRRAMQIEKFVGEAGKFRLTFEGTYRERHDMIVSLNARDNRLFLFSRMSEREILALVDQLISLG